MRERNLYRGLRNFEGSVDEEGNLYDERHMFVGRIVGNDVYDNSNIKQGSIDSNGKLWDINHTFVGEAHGNNFIGPSYQSTGMSRGDSFGEGNGCEYGALMMLKKRNEHYLGKTPDNNYNFPNDDDVPNDNDIFDKGGKAGLEDESWEDDYDRDEDWDDDDDEDDEDENEDDDWEDSDAETSRAECSNIKHCEKKNDVRIHQTARDQTCGDGRCSNSTQKPQGRRRSAPPDSDFSTGRKDEYCLNGKIYVDISRRSQFWANVAAFIAGLSGKRVITRWDRISGTWDRMKKDAARNRH